MIPLEELNDPVALGRYFPLTSQTSLTDRRALLILATRLGARQPFAYLEIGSYLGGTLAPFLQLARCTQVVSVDVRGGVQPDERGMRYQYTVTTAQMAATLADAGLPLDKLRTFDGAIDEVAVPGGLDFAFVDGEHTDRAAFRDALHARRALKPDAVLAFHDSSLTYKALQCLLALYDFQGTPYRFVKFHGSEVSAFLFGAHRDLLDDLDPGYFVADLATFFQEAEDGLLHANITNRVSFNFTIGRSRVQTH